MPIAVSQEGSGLCSEKKGATEDDLVDQRGCQAQNRGGCGLDDFIKVSGFAQVWGMEFCLQTPIVVWFVKNF